MFNRKRVKELEYYKAVADATKYYESCGFNFSQQFLFDCQDKRQYLVVTVDKETNKPKLQYVANIIHMKFAEAPLCWKEITDVTREGR